MLVDVMVGLVTADCLWDGVLQTAPSQEIISSAGKIPAPLKDSGVPCGVHLPPTEFHAALMAADPDNSVLIDVRCSKVATRRWRCRPILICCTINY